MPNPYELISGLLTDIEQEAKNRVVRWAKEGSEASEFLAQVTESLSDSRAKIARVAELDTDPPRWVGHEQLIRSDDPRPNPIYPLALAVGRCQVVLGLLELRFLDDEHQDISELLDSAWHATFDGENALWELLRVYEQTGRLGLFERGLREKHHIRTPSQEAAASAGEKA